MAKWTFGIADEIKEEPHPEDSSPCEFKVWFCVATDNEGHRLRSMASWDNFDEAIWCTENTQEVSDNGVENVAECSAWVPWYPVYGSVAYYENDPNDC